MGGWRWAVAAVVVAGSTGVQTAAEETASAPRTANGPPQVKSPNPSGTSVTLRVGGGPVIDPSNPFFQVLGTNGRSCSTCHVAGDNMTVTPHSLRERFEKTGGTDPIFRTNDGSNSPLADVSTMEARRSAYSLLLTRGVIRIGLPLPADAEFELSAVNDPYGFASASELSLFRRPLPATNLRFLSTVMWDARETFRDPAQPTGFAPLPFDLAHQANGATLGHAQAMAPLTQAQSDAIVAFETSLHTAQQDDLSAGPLFARGATGGTAALVRQDFHFGINDSLGGDPSGAPFDPAAMTLFQPWSSLPGSGRTTEAQRAIARGEELFNHRPIRISGVGGLNDWLGAKVIIGTCTTCHDAPNVGDHSVPLPLDIGTAEVAPEGDLSTTGLPRYTFRNKRTGQLRTLTDPGRALLTGKWADLGKFKGPILRGLAGRAPYFHNGSAASIAQVVEFYDQRFAIGFTEDEEHDLAAFLAAL